MAYTAGDKILDDEYNIFVNNSDSPFGYNHFAGTGSATYGLGQTHIPTVVAAAGTINASQWNTLLAGIDTIAGHTGDTMTARGQVTAGDPIKIKAAVAADLATLAASVNGGCTSTSAVTTNALGTSTNGNTWNSTSTIERSVTFANNATMRAFFNAGGSIRVDPATSGSTDGDKDTVFEQLTAAVGNLDIGAHATTRSGSGETQTSNGFSNGFHDLGTVYTSLLKLTSDNGGYTSNTVEISAKLDAAPATATVITIKMYSVDADNDDTYTSGNTDGVPVNPNEAPAMQLNIIEEFPTNGEGLASNIQSLSNDEVDNSQS